jgi:nitronate monooxygenase
MPKIRTAFTEMLGVTYPIVCAPMFLVSEPSLVIAACEAGALGAFPTPNLRSHDDFVAAVRRIKASTDQPFGVNVPLKLSDRLAADIDTIVREEVPLVITSMGDPSAIIAATRGTRTRVFCDVVNQRHADKVVRAGADGLVAIAYGAGGHAGQVSPFVLGPWLKRRFGLPVLAAGGIADGRGLAAALALGLDAAYMGTRFLATRECQVVDDYKRAVVESQPEDIVFTAEISGVLGNYIKGTLPDVSGNAEAKRWKDIWSAGQVVGLIDDVPTCRELVERIVAEYETARSDLPPVQG